MVALSFGYVALYIFIKMIILVVSQISYIFRGKGVFCANRTGDGSSKQRNAPECLFGDAMVRH